MWDSKKMRGVGFEPTNLYRIGASGRLAPRFYEGTSTAIDFVLFKKWLYQSYRPFTARPVYSYAKKYGYCLTTRNLSILRSFSDGKRSSILKALATLSKYLGMHEEFKALVKNYGLKWAGRSSDDIIIERLLKSSNDKELFEWVKDAKRKIPEIEQFLNLMVATGVRLIEAVESHNLIIKLSREGKLDGYFNEDRQILEHFRFKEIFIRNSKKVFISFAPSEVIHTIAKAEPLTYDRVQGLAEWHVKKLHFADLRELYASYSVKHLKQPEIDFLQGRVSASVFMRNYFNPTWISDLKKRALKNANELLISTETH
jgi:intergrase/recombinase